MKYVDGFLLSIPKDKIEEYKKIAKKSGKIWKEYGALDYVETVIDDPNAHDMAAFPDLSNIKKGELVVFSYITYSSKAQRNKVNKKVMSDPRMMCGSQNMPFDCKRMAYGGFKTIVDM